MTELNVHHKEDDPKKVGVVVEEAKGLPEDLRVEMEVSSLIDAMLIDLAKSSKLTDEATVDILVDALRPYMSDSGKGLLVSKLRGFRK